MKRINLLVVILLILSACSSIEKKPEKVQAKNVILMIADGMGVTHLYAAMSVTENPLVIEEFKHVGLQKTYSANNYITDSGASGTAMATGHKTNNQSIAVDTAGNPLKTILEIAEDNNLATGLVSTSSILHATPASFIAHEIDRNEYENIAYDFLSVDIDLFIGGGKKQFSERSDSLNLLDSLRSKAYNVVEGLENLNTNQSGKFAVFTADGHNPEISNGRGDMLPVSTKKAIEILSKNENGFFLMVEGSQIDWGGHDNDINYIITETIDFDEAVAKALEFAKNDGETLLIVTADHETGGLTIIDGDMKSRTIEASFSTEHHTSVMVPVFAYGPGAEEFGGIYENTEIFYKIKKALNL
jgi:alkaline phosphatase